MTSLFKFLLWKIFQQKEHFFNLLSIKFFSIWILIQRNSKKKWFNWTNFCCFFIDVAQSHADSPKPSVAPTNGLTRSRRSHFSLADTKVDSVKENATSKKSDVHVSYDNERLKMMAKFHHSRQFPNDWLKICELYPNIVRNKVRDTDDKNNNDLIQNNVMNNNFNKFHAKLTTQAVTLK